MENERATSSSEVLNDDSSSNLSLENIEKQNEEYSKDCEDEHKKKNADLVLDLRHVSAIYNSANSDDEDTFEKLSMVTEQPEEPMSLTPTTEIHVQNEESTLNRALRERIQSLHEVMARLREELKEEVALWKKEREEFQLLRERNDILALEEATAAARAAAAAYAAESPLSNDLDENVDITSEQTLRELTILEYEKKLAKYQDALSFAQAEKRYNSRRQMIAKAYKQKLLEVEKLCDEELEKIRRNANCLQPLKEMASRWYEDDKNCGDSIQEYNSNIMMQRTKIREDLEERGNYRKVDAEVNMVPEICMSKFKINDGSMRDQTWNEC